MYFLTKGFNWEEFLQEVIHFSKILTSWNKEPLIMDYKEESIIYNSTGLHNGSENAYVNISVDDYYDYYDYDYEDSVNTIPIEEIVPVAIVYGLTLLLGVIGNGLVIFSISR